MLGKKKVLFHSNYHGQLTGFGKNCKNILSALFSTGKYEIVELANGVKDNDPLLSLSPWKCIGMTPTNEGVVRKFLSNYPQDQREVAKKRIFYGDAKIDDVIKEERPDFYINVEDIWASAGYVDKDWWNKCECMIWTTLDSLPILPTAVSCANKVKHYYIWSDFATKDLNKRGFSHVKTLHGALKTEDFFRINDQDRLKLRLSHDIDTDFIIGFVFRNQLRKSVPNFLDGLALFKQKNKHVKAKALFVTSYEEGWDIRREILNKGLELSDVLTVFVCDSCSKYHIKPSIDIKSTCPHCSQQNAHTVNITKGLSEKQLNEIYNLMDVYCHPFTSGGQEVPIQEAKLAELITLVTNYSCGEEGASVESGGLPLAWNTYYEFGSQFIKASTCPKSIASQLESVYSMRPSEKKSIGEKARKYVIENYSIASISEKLQKIIDSAPFSSLISSSVKINPEFVPDNSLNHHEWLTSLYLNMLGDDKPQQDPNFSIALQSMYDGEDRDNVIFQYRQEAKKRLEDSRQSKYPSSKASIIAAIVNSNKDSAFAALKYALSQDKICCVFCNEDIEYTFLGYPNIHTYRKTYELEITNYLNDNFSEHKFF